MADLLDMGFAKLEFAHLQDTFETGLEVQGTVTDLLAVDPHTTLLESFEMLQNCWKSARIESMQRQYRYPARRYPVFSPGYHQASRHR